MFGSLETDNVEPDVTDELALIAEMDAIEIETNELIQNTVIEESPVIQKPVFEEPVIEKPVIEIPVIPPKTDVEGVDEETKELTKSYWPPPQNLNRLFKYRIDNNSIPNSDFDSICQVNNI